MLVDLQEIKIKFFLMFTQIKVLPCLFHNYIFPFYQKIITVIEFMLQGYTRA